MAIQKITPLALVLGATGGIGGAVAEQLAAEGWQVRAMNRDPDRARIRHPDFEWVAGDSMVEADVVAAAQGAQLIVHGVNPPAYRNWAGLQTPMLASTIAAARATGARIVFPGTVYNFGPDSFPLLDENARQHPTTRKGAIRVRMEQMLADAAADGAKVLIVRAGDFFGPEPGNNWLSLGMVKAGRPIAAVTYPGPVGVAHTWAYLPDVALTMVRLAMLPDLAEFEVFHMRGHVLTGSEMARTLGEAAGRTLAISRLPWLAVRAASPFNESLREMLEMRYLWETPVLMNNAKLVARLGEEPHTPTVEALREALAGMGALPHRAILVAATAPGLMKSTPPTWPAYRRESQTW